jgi:hypothetical protein
MASTRSAATAAQRTDDQEGREVDLGTSASSRLMGAAGADGAVR